VAEFTVEDELTKERFTGFSLKEKVKKMGTEGTVEAAIIIRNLY